MSKLGEVCSHGNLKRQCEICERDERIAELKGERDRYRAALVRVMDETRGNFARIAQLLFRIAAEALAGDAKR